MKIAILVNNYPPTICGIGDYTYLLTRELLAAGVEVHIICRDTQTGARHDGEHIHPVICNWDGEGRQRARQLVGELRPDWLIVQMIGYGFDRRGLPFNMLPLFSALKRDGVRTLTFFHEVRIRANGDPRRWAIARLQTFLARRMGQLSTESATSIDFYADVLKKGVPGVHLIPIGTGIAPVEVPPAGRSALCRRYGIEEGSVVVATFGNRDIRTYLPEFDRLAEEVPGLVWLLCGRVSTPAEVLKSRGYLRHTGELASEDIYRALSLGDVAFMPEPVSTEMEGGSSNKSTALACALSIGIPVIGVKGDLNNKLLKHNENIILVEIHRPGALYEALRVGLGEGPLREKLGHGARELFEKHLSWKVLGERFLSLMGFHPIMQINKQKIAQ